MVIFQFDMKKRVTDKCSMNKSQLVNRLDILLSQTAKMDKHFQQLMRQRLFTLHNNHVK